MDYGPLNRQNGPAKPLVAITQPKDPGIGSSMRQSITENSEASICRYCAFAYSGFYSAAELICDNQFERQTGILHEVPAVRALGYLSKDCNS